jgi:hypothetical protein
MPLYGDQRHSLLICAYGHRSASACPDRGSLSECLLDASTQDGAVQPRSGDVQHTHGQREIDGLTLALPAEADPQVAPCASDANV